ncbi:alpha/beta fold hydrolase [Streptomyces dubilierae]|uniref:Alpha/beta fold hydrolase n=1 Tax=Streptomyces dubilierae TaxID=3075533 RepID=A0ABU2PGK8_9ACTN|nr:alpha/beta fold hydrolase [Streptomyces sp. DSM 41921]MDT0390179.1 alpha/beta fold hydrolase [Streptomyces sp. DSM 41921]
MTAGRRRTSAAARGTVLQELLPGHPAREPWRLVPSTGQHYLDVGTGRPLLFLHGNATWSHAWRTLLPTLVPHARCLAPDLPGLGLSRHPATPADPAHRHLHQLDHVDALYRHVVRDEGVAPTGWTFVVHGWGGPLDLARLLRNPGVVSRLVVLDTIAFPWPDGHRLPFRLRRLRNHRPVAAAHAADALARATVRLGVIHRLGPAERRACLLPHARRGSRRAITEFARAVPRGPADPARRLLAPPEESDDLARLPMLIGWGMRDPVFSAEVLTDWTRRHPYAVVHRFPRAGHLVMDDAGAELGLRIRDFLLPEPVRGQR